MPRKVYIVPNEEGVFRIACGKDVVEIHVVAEDSILTPKKQKAKKVASTGQTTDLEMMSSGTVLRPIDRPIRTLSVQKGSVCYEKMDVDFASLLIRDQISTGMKSGVIGLPVGKGVAVDIHDLAKLRSEVEGERSGMGLAIGFGTQFKR